MRARPARARCRATASPWLGASGRRWPTSRCSGGTPTTSPIRRRGSACRSIPTRCSAPRSRRAWSIRRARNSSTSSGTIRWPTGRTPVQLKALARQVHAGKARYDGGYYAGFDHCDPREVEAYTSYGKSFRQLGLPFRGSGRDRGDRALPARRHRRRHRDHALVGPGLYVAGGLGGHSNGLIGLATYDGKVVADGVAADLPQLSPRRSARSRIEREAAGSRMLAGIAQRWRAGRAGQERHPRHDVGQGRGRRRMPPACVGARRYPGHPPRPPAAHERQRTASTANYEWLDAIDVINMVDVCELIIQSSLERKESRGPFMRRDFPMQDNDPLARRQCPGADRQWSSLRATPYELPFFKPDFAIREQSRGGLVATFGPAPHRARASSARTSSTTRWRPAIRGSRSATRLTVRVRRSMERRRCGIPGSLSQMDARARCAQLDRREPGERPRLPLVLRLEDVRHLRGTA